MRCPNALLFFFISPLCGRYCYFYYEKSKRKSLRGKFETATFITSYTFFARETCAFKSSRSISQSFLDSTSLLLVEQRLWQFWSRFLADVSLFFLNLFLCSWKAFDKSDNGALSKQPKNLTKDCNSKTKINCPSQGHCRATFLIHKREVDSPNFPIRTYTGLAEGKSEQRLNEHKSPLIKKGTRTTLRCLDTSGT